MDDHEMVTQHERHILIGMAMADLFDGGVAQVCARNHMLPMAAALSAAPGRYPGCGYKRPHDPRMRTDALGYDPAHVAAARKKGLKGRSNKHTSARLSQANSCMFVRSNPRLLSPPRFAFSVTDISRAHSDYLRPTSCTDFGNFVTPYSASEFPLPLNWRLVVTSAFVRFRKILFPSSTFLQIGI
jgi:hypothetical protein